MSVIILSGPTGSGKSSIAHSVAKSVGAVVVSADAMTVYKGMDIGTAKPTAAEQEEVHYFGLDCVNPDEEYSVFDFVQLVESVIKEHERVIIAGGTPYYLRALLKPHAPMPSASPEIRQRLCVLDDLHDRLKAIDPILAERLHPNDKVRIIRGLEVYELTGRPLSEVQKDPPSRKPLDVKVLWLERSDLRPRLGARIQQMVKQGYLEETQNLLAQGYTLEHKPMASFAYQFMIKHINGELGWEECLDRIEKGTWHLARKQRTWGRNMGFVGMNPEQIVVELENIFK